MRALFIGGVVDNSEMDLDNSPPPLHYPKIPEPGGRAAACTKWAPAAMARWLMWSMARRNWR